MLDPIWAQLSSWYGLQWLLVERGVTLKSSLWFPDKRMCQPSLKIGNFILLVKLPPTCQVLCPSDCAHPGGACSSNSLGWDMAWILPVSWELSVTSCLPAYVPHHMAPGDPPIFQVHPGTLAYWLFLDHTRNVPISSQTMHPRFPSGLPTLPSSLHCFAFICHLFSDHLTLSILLTLFLYI